MSSRAEKFIRHLTDMADIKINGSKPWDIQIHDAKFFERVFHQGVLGLGESYMDGWWDCENLDEFFFHVLNAKLDTKIREEGHHLLSVFLAKLNFFKRLLVNIQSHRRANIIGEHHYDLGNDLYQIMLDKGMSYTCGYWENAQNLDDAQNAKLKLVCDKLYLQPGMHVLDIGCGWGALAKYAAENYGVSVVGITVSKQQLQLGKQMCAGLPIELRFQDYRDVAETFDRVVSLGMLEHVGYQNYKTYMQCVDRCLIDNGLFLLHTIGSNESMRNVNPWIGKYIFPNSQLPSVAQISASVEPCFVMEDWHNFAVNYDKTLMCWHENFNRGWDKLSANYDERFRRMWNYYLLSSAGAFRARHIQLWQAVFSKGLLDGYTSIR